jgi:phospholipase/carboxylesterase
MMLELALHIRIGDNLLFWGGQTLSVYIKEAQKPAKTCVIWLHGLGADATDMMGLVEQLKVASTSIRHIFIDAPTRPVTLNGGMVMPAWYDILGMKLVDREDKQGIEQSELLIRQVIDGQIKEGLDPRQIILAGFSQGGAMAIHTALNSSKRLGGVIALSSYIPLAKETKPILDKTTPIFMGAGQFDPLVLPQWSQVSRDWLLQAGYEFISYHEYPMEHSICFEEIKDLSFWIEQQIQGDVE